MGTREFGTYFIAYAADSGVIETMLRNMFLGTEGAAHDRILDFSTAVTGTLFFIPTVEMLDDGPDPSLPDADGEQRAPAPPVIDGSLQIGGLRPTR